MTIALKRAIDTYSEILGLRYKLSRLQVDLELLTKRLTPEDELALDVIINDCESDLADAARRSK